MAEQAKIMTLHDHDTNEAIAPRTVIDALSGEGKKGQLLGFTDDNVIGVLDRRDDSVGGVNRNLLVNGCFIKECLVNQKGGTTYTSGPSDWNKYYIDGWYVQGPNTTLTVEDDGIQLLYDDSRYGENIGNWLIQKLENDYTGKTLTASVLASDNTLYVCTGVITETTDANRVKAGTSHSQIYVHPDNRVSLIILAPNMTSIKYVAAKVELGDKQTLAHQDENSKWVLNEIPDYGIELLKCQRYYQVFKTSSLRPSSADANDFRPVMRAKPAFTNVVINGQTYYAADANL